ncbi:heavy metal-associated isoprenylated plant protein 9 isoform X2 [Phalaenopsis equestris]|uniref:heavy metal-associated isoprenylated plant protein 9 isoform X2 n=1 Tax=Phalaenopsis equestris TaxID=78828 RepID=UPI0009E5BD69|nr:heavy metal-associated isoprenylated plant protein 9 isoform X2 [Phalaenopsis equestris]
MGEEAKEAEAKVSEAPKQEEKAAAGEKEEKKEEVKSSSPSPPPPIVLFVDLHCVGCAKKIERSILKCRGVEEVETKIEKNEVIVKGKVDPQALCALIQKKTSRKAEVLSPLPLPDAADSTKTQTPSPPPPPQTCGIATVELLVNMHCEACAQQLRKKIMKMGGVQAAETDQNAKKVTVTGTINAAKLVDYIHRRTGKIATIIPPSPPPPPMAPEEKKENGETKADNTEKLPEEKKENNEKKSIPEEAPKAMNGYEEMVKRMMYWNGGGGYNMMNVYHDDEMSKRMMTMVHDWMPMGMPAVAMPTTMVVYDRPQLLPPPPQMFSDENPNACSIS